ncbi:helix-turn-helix transcriptional regulator [Chondromyces crocatus]|uniref:HTH luxR-type domain-containing protein n=1 Tax=Chondromyces crocatus TaxID=52 RepID=A0A0K1EHJ7_CHOCO|nr:LuxR C-terminal-related transcriptional regulator [Chondromyces crocatus]AKT40340.1 uncharacterized protein CMC5_044930 [Chondromyces crocatus]
MAMLTPRGVAFPPESRATLASLNGPIRAALARIRLPFVSSQPILEQVLAEQALGYACISARTGALLEANRKAYVLADRYRAAMNVPRSSRPLPALLRRASQPGIGGNVSMIVDGRVSSFLDLHTHFLAKETHVLPEDIILIMMRDISLPQIAPRQSRAVQPARLTTREKEIATLLVESGLSYKQIADSLTIRTGTMRAHTENIYRKLEVHSRAELTIKMRR